MSANSEIWQVSCSGQVFEADLETLKEWIADGSVLPTDKVRNGNVRWIEAGQAPLLRRIFRGEVVEPAPNAGQAVPPWENQSQPNSAADSSTAFVESQPDAAHNAESQTVWNESSEAENYQSAEHDAFHSWMPEAGAHEAGVCRNHTDVPARPVCRVCGALFCAACPKMLNGVALCSLCGDLCKPYEEQVQKFASRQYQSSSFGLEDFGTSIRYPFKNLVALIFGALLYGLLLLGGLKGQLVAYMILFGCIARVITQVAWGRLDHSFLPDFSEFNIVDDGVVPLFLGVGVWLVSLGPMILLLIALWFGVLGPALSSAALIKQQQEAQAQQTKDDIKTIMSDGNTDEEKQLEAMRRLDPLHAGQYQNPNKPKPQMEETAPKFGAPSLSGPLFSMIPAWFILLFPLAILWAIFYYPMALAVAGYTERFSAVVNPLVGLDTMRRMGSVYVKAFLMYLGVEFAAIFIGVVILVITSPFTLPFLGNLPGTFLNGMVTFYTSLVIACTLGLALYKCADRLGIETD